MNQNKQEQWEVDLLKLDEEHGIIDVGGGDELEKKTKILKKFISDLISQTRQEAVEEERKNAVNDCWYAILDLPHDSETGYTAELDLDDIYEKFKQLKALSLKKEQE